MSFETAKKFLISITIVLILILTIFIIVQNLILPRITGEGGLSAQEEFVQLCFEWRKNNCSPDLYGSIPESNPGRLQELCVNLYPDNSENRCNEICNNNCIL
ncbi:MAG: hypothetical protein ACE5J4_03680 [Candidatus Aenigmatarchaeota archaeon]